MSLSTFQVRIHEHGVADTNKEGAGCRVQGAATSTLGPTPEIEKA